MKKYIFIAFFGSILLCCKKESGNPDSSPNPKSPTDSVGKIDSIKTAPIDTLTFFCNLGEFGFADKYVDTINTGDTLFVQLFCENKSGVIAEKTNVHIAPIRTDTVDKMNLFAGVASITVDRTIANSTIVFSDSASMEYVPESAVWSKNETDPIPVSNALFGSSGFGVGELAITDKGVLSLKFVVK